jgi:hypothetical protein
MKSMFGLKKTGIALAISLLLYGLQFFNVSVQAVSANGNGTINLPAGANKSASTTFKAVSGKALTVSVKLKNNGVPGQDPSKNLKITLRKPDDAVAGERTELVNPGATKTVSLSGNPFGGTTCQEWKLVLSNPNDGATNATATAELSYGSVIAPEVVTLSAFGLNQGQSSTRDVTIPHTGKVHLSGSWATDDNNPVAPHRQLTFELIKPNGTKVKTVTGYSSNSNLSPKVNLQYTVTNSDMSQGAGWKVRVTASAQGAVKDVKITRTFTRDC